MQVIRHIPAVQPRNCPSVIFRGCLHPTRSASRSPGQQQQQQFHGLAQHLQGTIQRTISCKVMRLEQNQDVVTMQNVPLIPLNVLLGNPLYSSAKVWGSSSSSSSSRYHT
jgi:hypothetical protein